jgi:multidrug efflux pump subunit AcrA (membrane-fusion protein)
MRQMKKKRWLWLSGILVVLLVIVGVIANRVLTRETNFESYEVNPTSVVKTVGANGQLAETQLLAYGPSEQPILISANGAIAIPAQFGVSLEINSIEVSVGDKVAAGDLLFSYKNQFGGSTRVTAQAAGIVRTLDTAEGLRTSGQVVTVGSNKPVVSVFASEYDADLLDLSQKASIELDAIDAVFEGAVISIGQVANSVSGIKQYEVLVEVKKIPTGARFGMSATAEIEVERADNVLAVPINALIGESPEVQILRSDATGDNQIESVKVTLGLRGDSLVEITSGIKKGDLVITGIDGQVPAPVEFGPPRGAGNNG